MTIPAMDDLDFDALEVRFGSAVFARGTQYFDEGRVGYVEWNEAASTLTASVRGNRATPYATSISVGIEAGRMCSVDYGRCNCPVVFNCKHIVATLLRARADGRTTARATHGLPIVGHWSQALAPIRRVGEERRQRGFGLQLGVQPSSGRSDAVGLFARPVRFDSRGAWFTRGVSWSSLSATSDHRLERQSEILRELHALSRVRAHVVIRHFYEAHDASLVDLSEVPGRVLWSLLDEARDAGVTLVHTRRELGEIPWPGTAAFVVDITGDDIGTLTLQGRVTVDDETIPSERRRFVGSDNAGIVYWDAGSDYTNNGFRLAALSQSVPAALRRVSNSSLPLTIPVADRTDFAVNYLPALERDSTIVSSDASYTPPVFAGPDLHITVTHIGGSRLTISALWRYYLDDREFDYAADVLGAGDGLRDAASEIAVLRSVLDLFGRNDSSPGLFTPFTVADTEAALFVVDVLPQLDGYDNVHVSTIGDVPDFEDVSDDVGVAVSTEALTNDNDWFDLGVVVTVDGTDIAFASVLTAITRGATHMLLDDGRFFSLARPSLEKLRRLVQEARDLQDDPEGPLRISRYQASLWEELAEIGEVTRQADAWRQQVAALLQLDSVPAQDPPPGLDAVLRPYQVDGYSWLSFLWTHGLGGILADDMGLGKTVQTLAMIVDAKEKGALRAPLVIVAPTSVVHNWAREAARFAPCLTVATVAETRTRRRFSVAEIAAGVDVVVTSYTVFRLDFDDFDAVAWSGLVLDEAQYVKNHKGKTYHCARRLSANFKLAITGTPMENNLMELWALLSITAPGLFPSPNRFIEHYRTPIERSGNVDVLNTLRRRIKPLVLRRTKEIVAQDLPPKQEQIIDVDLHPRHRKVYETRLARERQKILGLLDDFERNRVIILRSLTILRQLSLDASLVDDTHADIPSAKIDELVTQLRDVVDGGHRALVFSQFTRFLGRIRERLEDEGIELVYLDGTTRNRADVVERFTSGDAPVFLISLKAGGVGLTLTEADYCFIMDPWWNPATEAQAVDRAHRIGQTRTVFVNRYVARNTIEEKVMDLKERKAKLSASVLDDGGAFSGSLSADDIRGLFE
ncbi:helicase [Rhodococcus sp. BP-252]|uniref:DEAD/DEAH box helicase n=1 Tax=unclassified Rhodococcus (in: high G+C Gram-positive bacteria) TaxID=192944 RepID=UPI001430783B|nr:MULTISPECIES: DEAD/DEAH box helicase [unclassified Rhodococcus (in: high G+C Gram-positive bacteria)]MBY6414308.1 helicase [Rhodococcus sp. BP-320]MBY6419078.1 helicase [Rhodococcus sp. BP-321]MBY6423831.1 helicase [Rhodococcus sp. BP-324]MBY6429215.1 helicase [Rhodococcus sp. BP-323]MBY6434118.1 helicase [Rhodococcus sp. BP-322]